METGLSDSERSILVHPSVFAINIAPSKRAEMVARQSVQLHADKGIVGEHHYDRSRRQVTIQAVGELKDASALSGLNIVYNLTRRNITISADSVPRQQGHQWHVGSVLFEVIVDAAPCQRMDEIFGKGARLALKGRAGVVCKVLSAGLIRVGDTVDCG